MIRRIKRPRAGALLLGATAVSVAAAPHPPGDGIEGARLVAVRPLAGVLYHVQGLALDRDRLFVTSVDRAGRRGYLHEFDRRTEVMRRRIELTDGPRYHAGGLSISGRSIWVPVAEFRPNSSAVLVEIDAETLQVRRRIAVPDHLGCVAATGDTLVAGNWDSRQLYVFDLARGTRRVERNPSPTHFQDMKFANGALVAGGTRDWWNGTVDWLDWPSLKVRRSLHAGTVGTVRPFGRGGPYTGEALAIEKRDLFVVPEDGPSRLFRFRLAG